MIRRVLAVLAALLTGLLVLSVVQPDPVPAVERDRGCPRAFPQRLTADSDGRLFSRAVAEFVVCADAAGTTTLIANGTEAVWTLLSPTGVAVHRDWADALSRSFLRFVDSPTPVVPPGAVVVVARPPSHVHAVIDPTLTIAKLAHDELAASLAAQSPLLLDATIEGALTGNRNALTRCLRDVLARIPDAAESLLISGNPAPRIIDAAEEVAVQGEGSCRESWQSAKIGAGIPAADAESLAADVSRWRQDERFIIRAVSASISYLALTRPSAA
ncbi:hypothetical protein [Naasia sp. SYSU D00057]|uniref:hypothetical protein n=1 Tax=Naasia sp. SYSU D00057 TaxID=2817380 RepID=UPI001B300FB8|nr:hypothetical protein [Naasia sp. SYSU D00057]